jgi:hypothetical protein
MKALGAVQHARPEHGLGLGHVVAEEEDRVGVFDVAVRARLPSALGQAMSEAVIRCWRELHHGCGFS